MVWDKVKQDELNAAMADLQSIPAKLRALRAEVAELEKRQRDAKAVVDRARDEANNGI